MFEDPGGARGERGRRVNNLSCPVDNRVNNFCGEGGGNPRPDGASDRASPLVPLGATSLSANFMSIRSRGATASGDLRCSLGASRPLGRRHIGEVRGVHWAVMTADERFETNRTTPGIVPLSRSCFYSAAGVQQAHRAGKRAVLLFEEKSRHSAGEVVADTEPPSTGREGTVADVSTNLGIHYGCARSKIMCWCWCKSGRRDQCRLLRLTLVETREPKLYGPPRNKDVSPLPFPDPGRLPFPDPGRLPFPDPRERVDNRTEPETIRAGGLSGSPIRDACG